MNDLPAELDAIGYDELDGWASDDHAAAFAAFRLSAARIVERAPKSKRLGPEGPALVAAAKAALAAGRSLSPAAARGFFEHWFTPARVRPDSGTGFVTGYFEPEVAGALEPSAEFPVPMHAPPPGLQEIPADADRSGLDPALTWAIRDADGRFLAAPDRGAVMAGALDGKTEVLAYVANWVEAFFIHVQGSARIKMADGTVKRLTFAAKTGHPYFAIAKVLVEKGLMAPKDATADVLRTWLLDHPDEAPAVLARNRSYIFFRQAPVPDPALGPIAAADVPLTPGRSLAVDRSMITFHTPVFVSAELDSGPFRRLMVAQDTGSAILGPARGDLFFGTGHAAWLEAARTRHVASFTLLLPRKAPDGP